MVASLNAGLSRDCLCRPEKKLNPRLVEQLAKTIEAEAKESSFVAPVVWMNNLGASARGVLVIRQGQWAPVSVEPSEIGAGSDLAVVVRRYGALTGVAITESYRHTPGLVQPPEIEGIAVRHAAFPGTVGIGRLSIEPADVPLGKQDDLLAPLRSEAAISAPTHSGEPV
jgi:hypothetical protein